MLKAADFEYIANLVKEDAGIVLGKEKEYLVLSRVEPVAKSLGFNDIEALVVHLKAEVGGKRRRSVVESLTTHETSFFRDNEPFEALRLEVLPNLMKQQATKKELTIWCGASSSGQEPYSLCMIVHEHFPELLKWNVKLLATDVSRQILDKAKSGVYNQIEVNRGLPIRYLAKYFEKGGAEWSLKPEIRKMVVFDELNLLNPLTKVPQCDLVMLRNVLIYFSVETKRKILDEVCRILKPHGVLFLGTAETTLNLTENFDRKLHGKTTYYQKKV